MCYDSKGVTNRKVYKLQIYRFSMETKHILYDQGFSQAENQGRTGISSEASSLQDYGVDKLNSLREFVSELEILISEREQLSKIITDEAENIKIDIGNFLKNTTAFDAEGHKERNGLRQKQIEISELELNEKVNCWRDVALLKKELRERKRELSEKQDRMAMLDQIMD